MFLELIFRDDIFFIFNFSKMCCDKSGIRDLASTSPKGSKIMAQTEFCVHR